MRFEPRCTVSTRCGALPAGTPDRRDGGSPTMPGDPVSPAAIDGCPPATVW